MNSFAGFIDRFYYRNNKHFAFFLLNSLAIASAFFLFFLAEFSYSLPVYAIVPGYILVLYSFLALGKGGGIPAGFLFVSLDIAAVFSKLHAADRLSYILLAVFSLAYTFYLARFIDDMEEKESRFKIRADELETENREYKETTGKMKASIGAARTWARNYRTLNKVAQKMTTALERPEIFNIITEAVAQIIEKPSVKVSLLVLNEESGMFVPAIDEKPPDTMIHGAINIYKKDPFDEWITANKFTLLIKDVEDDFRFKDLKRETIKFRSMTAIPLIENVRIIGILKLTSDEPDAFNNDDVRLLKNLGDLCATAVQNSIYYQRTKDLAVRDGLTGLYIRRYFLERLDEEMRRARETSAALSFLLIDIDHFKDCNDTHGHLFGDKVLKLLGEFLRDGLRDVDIIGRYGGEEFAIILPNTNANGARFVAERLRLSFSKHIITVNEKQGIKLTLSIGGVEYDKATKLMELINKSDKALYHSKKDGRNMVTFWEDLNP
jgi:diguanylate cyclase (GGDEF)-like protein